MTWLKVAFAWAIDHMKREFADPSVDVMNYRSQMDYLPSSRRDDIDSLRSCGPWANLTIIICLIHSRFSGNVREVFNEISRFLITSRIFSLMLLSLCTLESEISL
jgi:hypothetical protein